MGAPTSDSRRGTADGGENRRHRSSRAGTAKPSLEVVDRLADSFPLLPGESQWLMALLADDLARILADDD